MDLTSESTTAAVIESFAETADPRLREILQELVPHLHDFVRKVRLTLPEWEAAIEFLTAVGQKCDANRQEFILLSDVLGVSMLVETMNGQEAGTESTVLGPFHVVASPERENGDSTDLMGGSEPCVVTGRVLGTDGIPLAGATVDVWQCSADGFYDVQQPDVQPLGNGRGLFHTDAEGRFEFRTVVPSHYPIPTDGPVGQMLLATGRHPFRPAHIHFIAGAPGHRNLTTHVFVAGSPYLDSDAVFAVKQSLVADFAEIDDADEAQRHGVRNPYRAASVELVLEADRVG
jgi:hydroxyquinol 1,2-dioxygenase